MPNLALRRRDPWWGLEGPAARRRYRRERFMSFLAFAASLVAIGGAGVAWAIQIGLATQFGFRLTLGLG